MTLISLFKKKLKKKNQTNTLYTPQSWWFILPLKRRIKVLTLSEQIRKLLWSQDYIVDLQDLTNQQPLQVKFETMLSNKQMTTLPFLVFFSFFFY